MKRLQTLIGQAARLAPVLGAKEITVIRLINQLVIAWLNIVSPAFRATSSEYTELQASLAENCP